MDLVVRPKQTEHGGELIKRQRGQYFTIGNTPFSSQAFSDWAQQAGLPHETILEPFAGANHIIHTLEQLHWCNHSSSFDLKPANSRVKCRDTIDSFPVGYRVCVTNPPWLAKNSATRRRLPFPTDQYDDVYKLCLELCLKHCEYVGALLPASYLQSGLFRDRLSAYVLLHDLLFEDTENPVCLALFTGSSSDSVKVYYDDEYVGELSQLARLIPQPTHDRQVRFNDPAGQLGFVSFDNTVEPTIRFCEVEEIQDYPIKVSSRFFTRVSGDFGDVSELINVLNERISFFRKKTRDLFLTPFKGIRSDGEYRRRMEFSMARKFINAA